jgi:hypothetical protein
MRVWSINSLEVAMFKRKLGILIIILGMVFIAVALAADLLGIGGVPGIGWKQILGTIVGVLVVLGGIWWGWGKK